MARHLKIENVDLNVEYGVRIFSGMKVQDIQTVSVFELDVINCRVFAIMALHLTLPNSFRKLRFENTVSEGIKFLSYQHTGLASYVIDNCTFMKTLYVEIQQIVDFKIMQSLINVQYDCEGDCLVHLKGVNLLISQLNINLMSDRKLSEIFFNRINEDNFFSLVDIESSTFKGGYGPFFTVDQAHVRLSKTAFHIQSYISLAENLINILQKSKFVYIKDVSMNLTSNDTEMQQVNIMSIVAFPVDFQNTQILCLFE